MKPWFAYRDGSLRLLGHPLHPVLAHFPMGLWPLVFPLELAGRVGGWDAGWRLAYCANAAGLALALPTALAGLFELAGLRNAPATAAANAHMTVMLSAACLFGLELFFRTGLGPIAGPRAFVNLGLSLAATFTLLAGGWLGGELVFRHGAGAAPEGTGERPNG
jgi:uncharacterized membrane protein